MKNTTLATLTLLAASSAAFAQSSLNKSGLSYDRVSVGYSSSSDVRTFGVNASALLGDNVLVGGNYQDVTFKNFGSVSGTATGFGLGYKFSVGSGDLVLSLGYAQIQAAGLSGSTVIAAAGESTTLGLAWRQKISDSLEYGVSYVHGRTNVVAGGYDLVSGASSSNGSSTNDNQLGLTLRYNLSKAFDVTAGYAFASGGNIWSLSAGYNF
jgi:hypothetical protein